MTNTQRIVRIFISSPGDVAEEREKARLVIEGLQKRFPDAILQPVLWEDLALPLTASFQETIELILHKQPIDIAVFILWSRLGSPLTNRVVRPDGTEYRSGTEREFDLMLEAFRQSGQKRPLMLAYTRNNLEGFQAKLGQTPLDKIQELLDQREMAEAFIREQFHDAEGCNLRAYHAYREPVDFAGRLRVHLQQALEELLGSDASVRWNEAPYRGLEVFDVRHAEIFRGRDDEICDLLLRLRDQYRAGCAFAVIVGASGAGKSSLARAGIAASLLQHTDEDGVKEWRTEFFVPAFETGDLLTRLTRALFNALPELRSSATALEDVRSLCLQNAALAVRLSIAPAFSRAAEQSQGIVRLLLVIDQMEELWTDRRISDDDRKQFFEVIQALARSGHVVVLATLRSDFYPHAQQLPTFLNLKGERGHFDLLPPNETALHRLITEPARLAGVRFERPEHLNRSLDALILQDAAKDPSALPLLQYALSELYLNRDEGQRLLTFAAYQAMGGVEGALGKRAEEVFQGLPDDAQTALNEVLPLLITLDIAGDQAAVRLRAPMHKLTDTAASAALTKALIDARFLTSDRQGDDAIVTLAHEALLRRWERIASWITSNREHLRLRARVEQSQHHWESQGQHASLLLSAGLPIEEGQVLVREARSLLLAETISYIERSIAYRQAESRRQRLIRTTAMTMSLIAAVTAILGAIWINAERNAAVLARNEETEAKNQQTRAKEALTQQVYDNSIAIAEREITQNHDIGKASRLLEGETCPEHLRGWEWSYLMRLRDGGHPPLVGHKTGLWGVEFSPDGTLIATCSIDGTLKFWDAKTRQLIRSIDADEIFIDKRILETAGIPRIPIMCLSFSPDGKTIATGSFLPKPKWNLAESLLPKPDRDSPGLVRIWDVATGKLISSFQDQKGVVLSLTFSPDGQHIASSSINPDNSFVVWNVKTSQVVQRVLGHKSHIHRLRYSPDGKILAAGETDGIIKLWDASSFKELKSIEAHTAPVIGISFLQDGSRFASAGEDGLVREWETSTGQKLLDMEGHAGAAFDVRYSPDGKRIASCGFDKTIRLWEAANGHPKLTLRGHKELVWGLSFSPDGQQLVSASFDNTAQVWDATPRPVTQAEGEFTVGGHPERVNCVAASADQKYIVSGSWDKTVRIWNADTGAAINTLSGHSSAIWCVTTSRDSRRIASASWDHTAKVWDRETGQVLLTFTEHTAPVHSVAFSPDGSRVASGGFDGQIKIWDSTSGKVITNCDGFIFPVMAVAFSPDGKRIASGGSDKSVKIWDANTGKVLLPLPGHTASIHALAFNHDGTRVASASWDHTVRIWDVAFDNKAARNRELHLIKGHEDRVNTVTFSADGRRIATASEDKTVRLWDAATGTEMAPTHRHRAVVWSVAFTPDGKRLVAADWHAPNWICVWNIHESNE